MIRPAELGSQAKRPVLPPYLERVLQCLLCGLDNSEITKELGISACTLKGYRSELIERFEVSTVTQVVAKAGRLGMFEGSRLSGAKSPPAGLGAW